LDWFGPVFIAAAAIVIVIKRRQLALMQSQILGGSVMPGCIITEAVALLILAAVMLFVASR